jgi:hypothetical protein
VKPVGDQDGNIQNPATKSYYVENPETVIQEDGKPHQGRWVQQMTIDQTAWEKTPKTHCPNGFPVKNHRDSDCKKELQSRQMEGFVDSRTSPTRTLVYAVAISGVVLAGIIGGTINLRK